MFRKSMPADAGMIFVFKKEKPLSFWMRDTICLNRVSGAWKIVHLHSSVPFYMDGSLRPAFDLQP